MKIFYIIKDCSDGVLLFRYMGLYTPGSCFRRDLLINFGKYDENSLLADYDLYLKLIEKKAKIMITPNSVIEIGTTERTTSKLIREKTWIFEQGRIVAKYAQHDIFKELLPVSIETWKPFEVARFLMYLAAGNEKKMLKAIESTNLPVVHQAKKEPCYKHVLLFKLLGHQGHRLVLKMVVIAQSIGQKLMRNNH